MPLQAIEILVQGIQANLQTTLRDGNIVHLPDHGSLIITGDLHGHVRNFERIVSFAALDAYPDRHVVLQEIIHGGPQNEHGGCLSYKLLLKAIQFKQRYPDRVHIILSNHDTAFVCDAEVMKDGREMNRSLYQALEQEFGNSWTQVRNTMRDYFFSLPLAVRTANRIWMSHSLPADRFADQFDAEVLHRKYTAADITKPGSVYLLTWGRRMSQALLDRFAGEFDTDLFVLGHQPQTQGWGQAGSNLIILAGDHNHGCILPIQLDTSYTIETMIKAIVPLSAIA